jgi:peptide/nickel transport system substrate-binding protein
MDRETRRHLEGYRRDEAGPVENTLVDELLDGELDRRAFLHRGAMLGLGTSIIGAALAAAGEAPLAFASADQPQAGGRIRVALGVPETAIEPQIFVGLASYTGSIAGEFLTRRISGKPLKPELAVGWKPNKNATVWTVKLRPNVKFQNGQPLTADDVVATFKRICDPHSTPASQALSVFKGVLSPGGVRKVDKLTVAFHLDSPYVAFPYAMSTTTYQAIILPANYKIGTFVSEPQCTGAFKLTSYTPGVGATFDRFPGWWGGRPPLDGVDVHYYSDPAAASAGLLGNAVDLIQQVTVVNDPALFNNKNVKIFRAAAANHRQLAMRVDLHNPFRDYRVRQAVALALDRPAMVKTLFRGFAQLGNDSPFAPSFLTTARVPQRHKDLRKARQLLDAAGYGKGFSTVLTTERLAEIPQEVQIIQQSLKPLGIHVSLDIQTTTEFFGGTQTGPPSGWGNTPWLNGAFTNTDWFDRAVPDVYLTSAYRSRGVWNESHYSSKRFDAALKSYLGSISPKDQRKYAKQMELLLLHDTPTVIPYFFNALSAGSPRVRGYYADAINFYLSRTSLA